MFAEVIEVFNGKITSGQIGLAITMFFVFVTIAYIAKAIQAYRRETRGEGDVID